MIGYNVLASTHEPFWWEGSVWRFPSKLINTISRLPWAPTDNGLEYGFYEEIELPQVKDLKPWPLGLLRERACWMPSCSTMTCAGCHAISVSEQLPISFYVLPFEIKIISHSRQIYNPRERSHVQHPCGPVLVCSCCLCLSWVCLWTDLHSEIFTSNSCTPWQWEPVFVSLWQGLSSGVEYDSLRAPKKWGSTY